MKRLAVISLAASLGMMGLGSCNLNLEPENSLTYNNSFNTESELNATTTAIHDFLFSIPDVHNLMVAGAIYDKAHGSQEVRLWSPRSVVESSNSWKLIYNVIFEANLLLDNIHRTTGLSEDRRAYHEGQAHFALGLSYLTLAQRFGTAVITDNSEVIKKYRTSSQMEVIDKALEHAQKAYDILPTYDRLRGVSGELLTARQYASKGSAAALLAHLYAWKGSMIDLYGLQGSSQEAYEKSVRYATDLISQKVGIYSLYSTPEALCQALSTPSSVNQEAIFSFAFNLKTNEAVSPNMYGLYYVIWPVLAGETLANCVAYRTPFLVYKQRVDNMYDSSDLRRSAFFYQVDESHEVEGQDYALPYKFRDAITEQAQNSNSGIRFRTLNSDYVYWRLADIYLLRAECYNKLGRTGEAIADLNVIRKRAGAAQYPSNGESDLKLAIFRERERELIFENDHRYFDVMRNGKDYVRKELQGRFTTLTDQEIQDGALFLPISTGAYIDKNGRIINPLIRQQKYWQAYVN